MPESYCDLYRICRAMSKAEQATVRVVADQYFPIADDGLRWNKRARRDIARAQPRIQASRNNGGNGGRKRTQQVPSRNPAASPTETQQTTQPGEASPYTMLHTKAKPKTSAPKVAPPGVDDEVWDAWVRQKGKKQTELADKMQRKHLAEWLALGHDVNRIVEASIAGHHDGLYAPKGSPPKRVNGGETAKERGMRVMDEVTGSANERRTITGSSERVDSPTVPALPGDLRKPT